MNDNKAWECPRCGRMNAPFNPACFCKPGDDLVNSATSADSAHIMDAARYLNPESLYKILEAEKRKAAIAQGMMPNFYNSRCSICDGIHFRGQDCMTLQNNLPKGGEFI